MPVWLGPQQMKQQVPGQNPRPSAWSKGPPPGLQKGSAPRRKKLQSSWLRDRLERGFSSRETLLPLRYCRVYVLFRGQVPRGAQSASCSPSSVAHMHSLTLGRENHCHGLPFTVRGPAASFSLCNKHSCTMRSCSSSDGRNKQRVEQESDMSCSRFGNEQIISLF